MSMVRSRRTAFRRIVVVFRGRPERWWWCYAAVRKNGGGAPRRWGGRVGAADVLAEAAGGRWQAADSEDNSARGGRQMAGCEQRMMKLMIRRTVGGRRQAVDNADGPRSRKAGRRMVVVLYRGGVAEWRCRRFDGGG